MVSAVEGRGPPLIFYGEELFPTLDELAATPNGGRRHFGGLWTDGGNLVLRDAQIYPRRLPADPAGAVSARHSCVATWNGLPLLPQLR